VNALYVGLTSLHAINNDTRAHIVTHSLNYEYFISSFKWKSTNARRSIGRRESSKSQKRIFFGVRQDDKYVFEE